MGILEDLAAVPSYFQANAKPGDPLSYQALQTRRKIAEQLMGRRSSYPKNVGEGIASIGESISDAWQMNRLDEQDRLLAARQAQSAVDANRAYESSGTAVAPAAGRADAGTDTTAPVQTAQAPYSAPGAAPGNVPLPPPRPARLRDAQLAQLQEDPALMRRAAAMTLGEVDRGTSPAERQTQFASALDRAGARGIPVAQALETYTGKGSRGYYPPDAFARGEKLLQKPGAYEAFQRDIATPVLRGADPGAAALGFTPTGNASGGVAQRGVASGRYNVAGSFPGSAETYVQQESPAQLARLEAGRNRIAAAASPSVQTAALTTPGVTSDAGPASAIADGASTAIAALPAQQPAQTPPLIPGGPPIRSPIPLAPPAVRTTQAGGFEGSVPGPMAPTAPESPPPSVGRVPTVQAETFAQTKPPAPTPIGRDELRAIAMMNSTQDPVIQQQWGGVAAYFKAQRDRTDKLNDEAFKSELERQRTISTKRLEHTLGADVREADLREKEQKIATAEQQRQELARRGGVTPEQAFTVVKESHKDAASIPGEVAAIRNAQRVLPEAVTGFGADAKVNILRVLAAAGQPVDPSISATQQFQSYVKGVYGRLRPQVIGAGPQANQEGKVLEKAAAGDISMDPGAINAVLNSIYALNVMAANEHQKKVAVYTGPDPKAQQYAYGTFGLRMQDIVPDAAVRAFREHYKENPTAAVREINEDFNTPGLGQELLKSGRI